MRSSSHPARVRRALLLLVVLTGTLALGACTERDPNNPFLTRTGANDEAPYGNGVSGSEPSPPAEPDK